MSQGVATLHIGQELFGNVPAAGNGRVIAKDHPVCLCQEVGILVGLATDHHAIHFTHVLVHFLQRFNTAIENDLDVRKSLFDGIGALVDQRGISRFSLGESPDRMAFRAWMVRLVQPAASMRPTNR